MENVNYLLITKIRFIDNSGEIVKFEKAFVKPINEVTILGRELIQNFENLFTTPINLTYKCNELKLFNT